MNRSGAGRRIALCAVSAAVLLAMSSACSDDPDLSTPVPDSSAAPAERRPATAEQLEGSTYLSTKVTGRELVAGSQVRLLFEDGVMGASGGCNTATGTFEVDAGLLRWTKMPVSTLIGCTAELESQDRWLAQWLTDGLRRLWAMAR